MPSDITVVIPTSPIPSHPSTALIEETIDSIRNQLPDSPIMILCDGVRKELEHRRLQYNEYIYNLVGKSNGAHVSIFNKHKQQSGMLRSTLKDIKTPLLFFCEHDATIDAKPINWSAIEELLHAGEANTVRLYWHCELHPQHLGFMGARHGEFVQTTQWSSWPHISRVDFYKRVLEEYFRDDEPRMTEANLYGPVCGSPWENFKTWIYAPEPDAIRFHHRDGRRDRVTGEKDFGDW